MSSSRIEGASRPLLIAGPCVIESESLTLSIAQAIAKLPITREFQFIFKASYLKDNRSSTESFRGIGVDAGLSVLAKVRESVGCRILSDVHTPDEVPVAARSVDVLQIPAFLSRQTSLLEAAAKTGKTVNVKKGQFLAPEDMAHVVKKLKHAGAKDVWLTERGTTFGYHDLVVDFRGFERMRATGCPVIFDVTHSLQRPGGLGGASGGEPALVGMMARAAAAVPVDGFFIETHPEPAKAKSDAASMLPLDQLEGVLIDIHRVWLAARG